MKQITQIFFGESESDFNSLGTNMTKWSNALKQFVGKLPTNCLNVFDHFVELALKGLILEAKFGNDPWRDALWQNSHYIQQNWLKKINLSLDYHCTKYAMFLLKWYKILYEILKSQKWIFHVQNQKIRPTKHSKYWRKKYKLCIGGLQIRGLLPHKKLEYEFYKTF